MHTHKSKYICTHTDYYSFVNNLFDLKDKVV